MEKESGNMTAADLIEQQRFIESFDLAMKQIDANREAQRKGQWPGVTYKRTAYDELKDAGNWNAEWLAGQYVLLVAKQGNLSLRLRKFIARVAYEAKVQYDKKYDNGKEAAK